MAPFKLAIFGNRDGSHQLLETNLAGEESLLEELRFLVDRPVGHVGAEVAWSPYWGCGPIRDWWALWCGEEDQSAPRKNMVKSRAVLVRLDAIGIVDSLQDLLDALSFDGSCVIDLPTAAIADALVRGAHPVVVPGIATVPALLRKLWPRLWPAARRQISIRTLFGSETIESGPKPHVVAVPAELLPRWRAHHVVDRDERKPRSVGVSWLCGDAAPGVGRLLCANWERLPGEFAVLARLERIALAVNTLREDAGKLSDALVIIRTIEAFDEGIDLPVDDLALVRASVSTLHGATITDIRTASLVKLKIIGDDISAAESTTSHWIRGNLPNESDTDALWVLKHQARDDHVVWWLRAIRAGLSDAFKRLTPGWATALWRWWSADPDAVDWTQELLSATSGTEEALLTHAPKCVAPELQARLVAVCAQRQWPRLLAHLLRSLDSLEQAVGTLREKVRKPERGLDFLLQGRAHAEAVAVAAASGWQPLVARAVKWTIRDPLLLDAIRFDSVGTIAFLAAHLKEGGHLPPTATADGFVRRVFDGCIDGDQACAYIARHIGTHGGRVALQYSRQDELWDALRPEGCEALLSATAAAWLNSFVASEVLTKPGPVLSAAIGERARDAFRLGPARTVIRYIDLFQEVSESEVVQWLADEGFSWQTGDDERFAELLVERDWRIAAQRFRYSWKRELQAVAWHARDLLGWWDVFWSAPPGVTDGLTVATRNQTEGRASHMKILFLAANPMPSNRLAIGEEARAIEEELRRSKLRDAVEFCTRWAVRPGDLQRTLLEERPTVVHFSGHGGGTIGVVLHSEAGTEESLVSSAALADLFKVLMDNIRVVVLNACYTEEQARAIVREIDFVVGMSDSIGDDGARVFAAAFYRGLAFGKSVQTGFDLGLSELKLMGLKNDEEVPVLLTRDGVDASVAVLVHTFS